MAPLSTAPGQAPQDDGPALAPAAAAMDASPAPAPEANAAAPASPALDASPAPAPAPAPPATDASLAPAPASQANAPAPAAPASQSINAAPMTSQAPVTGTPQCNDAPMVDLAGPGFSLNAPFQALQTLAAVAFTASTSTKTEAIGRKTKAGGKTLTVPENSNTARYVLLS